MEKDLNKKEAAHILGHIYGMLQYAQLHDNVIENISDEAMIYILNKLKDIIQRLDEGQ